MIVNYTESGWQIITQRSHGLLAGQLCANWRVEQQPENWIETLIAAAEHDDVYNEFEQSDLLNDNGGPVNYTMTKFGKAECDKLMGMAITKSAYIALLTSRHIQFVHGTAAAAKNYCKALRKQEKEWLAITGVSTGQIDNAYKLLQFCDAFSLIICHGSIQPAQRKMEISKGLDDKFYQVSSTMEVNHLEVSPWPFEKSIFTVNYESRTLSQLSFKSITQFRKAFDEAKVVRHELVISNPK